MPLLLGDLPDPYKETLPLSSELTPVVSIGGASRPAPHQTVNPLRADSECESPLGLPQQSLAYSSNSSSFFFFFFLLLFPCLCFPWWACIIFIKENPTSPRSHLDGFTKVKFIPALPSSLIFREPSLTLPYQDLGAWLSFLSKEELSGPGHPPRLSHPSPMIAYRGQCLILRAVALMVEPQAYKS